MKRNKEQTLMTHRNLLDGAGIDSLHDLMHLSVSDLICIVGSDEVDDLLESLLLELVFGKYDGNYKCRPLTLDEGHDFVCDVFEANDFNENLEGFYEITVSDFLDLEDLMPNNIPFLTGRIKNYVETGTMLIPERYTFCDSEENYAFFYEMEAVKCWR